MYIDALFVLFGRCNNTSTGSAELWLLTRAFMPRMSFLLGLPRT